MATISKEAAIDEAEKCAKQERPKTYVVIRYVNSMRQSSEGAFWWGRRAVLGFMQAINSPVVGEYQVLFASKRFKDDFPELPGEGSWNLVVVEPGGVDETLDDSATDAEAIEGWANEGGA